MEINSQSKRQLDIILNDLPQSLLVTGPEGIGMISIIEFIGQKLDSKPVIINPEYEEKVNLDKGIIGVDIIRRLYDLTKSKAKGKSIMVINRADKMNTVAQNAFLKLLEEPRDNVHFILLCSKTSVLLPTILSRLRLIELLPLTKDQSIKYLQTLGVKDDTKITQLLFIASGLPEELAKLATDEEYFNKRALIIKDARILLQGNAYQKLLLGDKYKNDRENSLTLLNDAMKQLQMSMMNSQDTALIDNLQLLLNAYDRITANGNIRLQLATVI